MNQATEKRPLTPDDPVDAQTLEQFRRLQEARQRCADSLLSLEQEKIQILAAAKKLDDQRTRLFEGCLVERGLAPDTAVEIDAKTGRILVSKAEPEAPQPAVAKG
jgi:hypothetical protein